MTADLTTFPDVYEALDTSHLMHVYAEGPARVRRALDGLSDEALRAHPIPEKWSVLEIAMHVVDSELMGAARMRLVLGDDEPMLPLYDQDRWSRDFRYQEADASRLEPALGLFTALRAATRPLLADASPGDWARTGTHPEYGAVTLRQLLELYADHSERHVEQIVERRGLLGSPIDLPSLLPERLY